VVPPGVELNLPSDGFEFFLYLFILRIKFTGFFQMKRIGCVILLLFSQFGKAEVNQTIFLGPLSEPCHRRSLPTDFYPE